MASASAGNIACVNSHEAFDRADPRGHAEQIGDVVHEVLTVRELAVSADSHDRLVHTTLSKCSTENAVRKCDCNVSVNYLMVLSANRKPISRN
jgi:hypothetical protein